MAEWFLVCEVSENTSEGGMKVQMLIELDYDADLMHGGDQESKAWFRNEIMGGKRGQLILHSNEIGDEIGEVRVITASWPD